MGKQLVKDRVEKEWEGFHQSVNRQFRYCTLKGQTQVGKGEKSSLSPFLIDVEVQQ